MKTQIKDCTNCIHIRGLKECVGHKLSSKPFKVVNKLSSKPIEQELPKVKKKMIDIKKFVKLAKKVKQSFEEQKCKCDCEPCKFGSHPHNGFCFFEPQSEQKLTFEQGLELVKKIQKKLEQKCKKCKGEGCPIGVKLTKGLCPACQPPEQRCNYASVGIPINCQVYGCKKRIFKGCFCKKHVSIYLP
jgi:hypothetical protein